MYFQPQLTTRNHQVLKTLIEKKVAPLCVDQNTLFVKIVVSGLNKPHFGDLKILTAHGRLLFFMQIFILFLVNFATIIIETKV